MKPKRDQFDTYCLTLDSASIRSRFGLKLVSIVSQSLLQFVSLVSIWCHICDLSPCLSVKRVHCLSVKRVLQLLSSRLCLDQASFCFWLKEGTVSTLSKTCHKRLLFRPIVPCTNSQWTSFRNATSQQTSQQSKSRGKLCSHKATPNHKIHVAQQPTTNQFLKEPARPPACFPTEWKCDLVNQRVPLGSELHMWKFHVKLSDLSFPMFIFKMCQGWISLFSFF